MWFDNHYYYAFKPAYNNNIYFSIQEKNFVLGEIEEKILKN